MELGLLCTSCGRLAAAGASFCSGCGHPLIEADQLSVDRSNILFRGVGTTADQITVIGLYLYDATTRSVLKVIDRNDTIRGKAIADLTIGRQSLDGSDVSFHAEFSDGTEALYVAFRVP